MQTEWVTIALAVLTNAVGALIAIASFAWIARGWVEKQFRDCISLFTGEIRKHEELDNTRHLQNLQSFSKIAVALAYHKIKINGDGAPKDN